MDHLVAGLTTDEGSTANSRPRIMMNPRYERAAERLAVLIEEGNRIAALERPVSRTLSFIQDYVPLRAWLVSVDNIVRNTFGEEGTHSHHVAEIRSGGVFNASKVHQMVGVLTGALDDLNGGYLVGQEHLIAGEIFDSVLEQARHLAKSGYKDPAAVLARVVLEDALKRLARDRGLASDRKVSAINDELRDRDLYNKPQWRLIQSWLDIGNAAAHGEFGEYTREQVLQMISDVGRFVAQLSGP